MFDSTVYICRGMEDHTSDIPEQCDEPRLQEVNESYDLKCNRLDEYCCIVGRAVYCRSITPLAAQTRV